MENAKTFITTVCILLALLLLIPAFAGCADMSDAGDSTPETEAKGIAGQVTDGKDSVDVTDTAAPSESETEPADSEPEQTEAYDTYEAFMKFINGLNDQEKIDLVQRTADSITVVVRHWESGHPHVEDNPDAYEKVKALGPDIFPYLIRYAYCVEPKNWATENMYMLMFKCATDDAAPPELPQPFGKVSMQTFEYWPVRYYLWYMEKQA